MKRENRKANDGIKILHKRFYAGRPERLAGLEEARANAPITRHPSAIILWMRGGPSHIDMWDPKPDAPIEYRGEFGVIRSNVPGVHIPDGVIKRLEGAQNQKAEGKRREEQAKLILAAAALSDNGNMLVERDREAHPIEDATAVVFGKGQIHHRELTGQRCRRLRFG